MHQGNIRKPHSFAIVTTCPLHLHTGCVIPGWSLGHVIRVSLTYGWTSNRAFSCPGVCCLFLAVSSLCLVCAGLLLWANKYWFLVVCLEFMVGVNLSITNKCILQCSLCVSRNWQKLYNKMVRSRITLAFFFCLCYPRGAKRESVCEPRCICRKYGGCQSLLAASVPSSWPWNPIWTLMKRLSTPEAWQRWASL